MVGKLVFIILVFLIVGCFCVHAAGEVQANPRGTHRPIGHSIWDLPLIPEQDMDIGFWTLAIAKECDSSVNIDKYLYMLDTMAARIQYMVGPREGDMIRFVMAKTYQFDAGEWNNDNTFSYDLDDPLGEQPGATLLTTYLNTRKGNCVSMPTLFLALMERVDREVPFHAVLAPLHLFCRLHDRQGGKVWNVEPTNGGNNFRDEWAIEQFGLSPVAIDRGTYMRDLTKKELIAELLGEVISKYRYAGEYEEALRYTELALELNPRSLTSLVQKGALLGWLGHTLKGRIKAEKRSPTVDEKRQLKLYMVESENYISIARSLGWEPETPESRARYLQLVKEAKSGNLK